MIKVSPFLFHLFFAFIYQVDTTLPQAKVIVLHNNVEYDENNNLLKPGDSIFVKITNNSNSLYSITKIQLKGTFRIASQVQGKYINSDFENMLEFPDDFKKNPIQKIEYARSQFHISKLKIKIVQIKEKTVTGVIKVNPSIHTYNKSYKFIKPLPGR